MAPIIRRTATLCVTLLLALTGSVAAQEGEPAGTAYDFHGLSIAIHPDADSWAIGYRGGAWTSTGRAGFTVSAEIPEAAFTTDQFTALSMHLGPTFTFPGSSSLVPFIGGGWAPSWSKFGEVSDFVGGVFYVAGGGYFLKSSDGGFSMLGEAGFDFGSGGSALVLRFAAGGVQAQSTRECNAPVCLWE